jgi:hypothetical protein
MALPCSSTLQPWLVAGKKIHIHHFGAIAFHLREKETSLVMKAQSSMIQISHSNHYLSAATVCQEFIFYNSKVL